MKRHHPDQQRVLLILCLKEPVKVKSGMVVTNLPVPWDLLRPSVHELISFICTCLKFDALAKGIRWVG